MIELERQLVEHCGELVHPASGCSIPHERGFAVRAVCACRRLDLIAMTTRWVILTVFIVSGMTELAVAHPGAHHDIEVVTEKLKANPDDVRLIVQRGFLYRLEDDLASSLQDLDRAIELAPNDPAAGMHRGLTLSAMGRDEEAERELTRVAEAASSSVVYSERGRIRERAGRAKAAIADFTTALSMDPDVELYLERGRLQESLGLLDEAADGYRDGLHELGPAVVLVEASVNVNIKRERFDIALALIDEQMASVPVRTEWYLRRARVLELSGRVPEAAADREKALADADRVLQLRAVATHLLSRARALIALGRMEEAKKDLQLALQKSPKYRDAQELLKSIEKSSGRVPASSVKVQGELNAE